MELKKREYALFYAIAALLGLWLITKIIFAPFHAKLSAVSRQVSLENARLKKGLGLLEKKKEINDEYNKYASYFSLHGYSDEEAVADFLKGVEKIGRESGVTILDMKPQREVKTDKISKQYSIQIKAEANMKQLVGFLYAIHNSSLLFSVEKMTLVPKSEDSPDLSISLTVVGVSFL